MFIIIGDVYQFIVHCLNPLHTQITKKSGILKENTMADKFKNTPHDDKKKLPLMHVALNQPIKIQ